MLKIATLSLALVSCTTAFAENGHSHAAANGGQIVTIGVYEVELVAKPTDVELFLTDLKDNKVEAKAFSASAVVLARSNKRRTIELVPAGGNRLSGKYDFAVEGKFRAVVSLKRNGSAVGKGRYSLAVK
ncbi:MAG: hypothetical protein AB7F96_03345 [Beijerinckiaceae bacterium]